MRNHLPGYDILPPMSNSILNFTLTLARETGDMLLDYFYDPKTRSSLKADHTVITEADLAADKRIHQAIQTAFPGEHILSEEHLTNYPDLDTPTWVIDPIDGTTNFSLGIHIWGVSIARVVGGLPDVGVIYFPVIKEMYHATRGGGAYLNDQPIQTRPYDPAQPATLFFRDTRMYQFFEGRIGIKSRILGSAAYNICAVARGMAVAGFESTPKIWDLAASWLILEEAGGLTHEYGGEAFPMQPGVEYGTRDFPLYFAADAGTLQRGKDNIRPR